MKYDFNTIRQLRSSVNNWLAKRRNQRKLTYIVMGLVIAGLFFGLVFSMNDNTNQNHLLVERQHKLSQLHSQLLKVQKQNTLNDTELKQKQADEANLNAQIDSLNKQLQAKAEAKRLADQQAISAPTQTPQLSQPSLAIQSPILGGCQIYWSGDLYLDNIIRFESGGNSCATNPGGCFGLLQACPGLPLRLACGGDPTCQIAWFIANKTGGRTWAQVWQHELAYGWW